MLGVAPIARPEYGGPIRSRAIFEAFRRAYGEVRYVAVHAGHRGVKTGPYDIAVGTDPREAIRAAPYLADVICGDAIGTDPEVRRRLTALLAGFAPDIIVVEQVFPYLGLRTVLDELALPAALVYSAHNIEHEMKQTMYEGLVADPAIARSFVERIRDVELEIIGKSALVAAVSEEDLDSLRRMGARRLVLAPNGASPLRASPGALWWHRANLARWGIHRSIVFVSSAHQPNWQGFLDLVGTRLGFLPSGTSLLICGSVGDLIGMRVSPVDVENETFWLRAKKLGRLPADELAATILLSDVVILPIAEGGGSNIKTAEALTSGRPIVGTAFAFRGYDDYRAVSGVRLADTPAAFRSAIASALAEGVPHRSDAEVDAIRRLQWSARLQPFVDAMDAL